MVDQAYDLQTTLDLRGDVAASQGSSVELTGHARAVWTRASAPDTSISLGRWVLALVALDLLMSLTAAMIAFELRFGAGADASLQGIPYWLLAATVVPVWVAVLAAGGSYDRRFLASGSEEYRRVFSCGVSLTGTVAFIVFVLHVDLSREFVGVAFPLMVALTLFERHVVRKALHRRVASGHPIYRTLVLGSHEGISELRKHMDRVPWAGFKVVDTYHADGEHIDAEEVLQAVRDAGADTIAVAGAHALRSGALRSLSWRLETTGVRLVVAPAVTDVAGPRIIVRPVEGLPLLMVEDPQMRGGRRLLKELLDRSFALLGLVVASPALVAVAIAIKVSSRGPVFYRQERVGLRGERFTMWKFRSMRVGADRELSVFADLNHADGLLFKIRQDPRVTKAGRWIRRHSIDEIPQFWNVLMGQMSLVGPRPPLPHEVEKYGDDVRRRLLVKPGMTGLWQISGRTELPWEESVRLDLFYVENWSVMMDLTVMWKTLAAVLHGRGAY